MDDSAPNAFALLLHLQLPLYPLVKSKLVLPDDIIVDAKSGA
jgi:N-acetyl-gamma-glutamylphosphate reductase